MEKQASFDIVVRFPDSARENLETLRGTLLTLPSGATVPFAALADIRQERGPNTITRENVQRKLVVMANVADCDLISVAEDTRAGDRHWISAQVSGGYTAS